MVERGTPCQAFSLSRSVYECYIYIFIYTCRDVYVYIYDIIYIYTYTHMINIVYSHPKFGLFRVVYVSLIKPLDATAESCAQAAGIRASSSAAFSLAASSDCAMKSFLGCLPLAEVSQKKGASFCSPNKYLLCLVRIDLHYIYSYIRTDASTHTCMNTYVVQTYIYLAAF